MSLSLQKTIRFLALVVIVIAVCVFGYSHHDPVLAKVGETKIHKSEADYRDKIIHLSFPDEKRSMGLYQLIKSAIHYEVLKNYGVQISEETLAKEEKRIDEHTRDPENLKQIKEFFKGDPAAYREVFIRPTLVDRVIYYDFFLKVIALPNTNYETWLDREKAKLKIEIYDDSLPVP